MLAGSTMHVTQYRDAVVREFARFPNSLTLHIQEETAGSAIVRKICERLPAESMVRKRKVVPTMYGYYEDLALLYKRIHEFAQNPRPLTEVLFILHGADEVFVTRLISYVCPPRSDTSGPRIKYVHYNLAEPSSRGYGKKIVDWCRFYTLKHKLDKILHPPER